MKSAWMFPGQGAQSAGMGKDLFGAHAECRALFARASEVLDYDLARLCLEGPIEELTRSDRAQPAIFTVSAAALAAYRRMRPAETHREATPMAGLSSGEWAALYAAGVIGFEDTVRVLAERGRLMQAACEENPGGMVSVIGLDPEGLASVCERTGAWISNQNSADQTVLSGPADILADLEAVAAAAGARRVIRLNVAGAFHSPLMAPAAKGLARFLESVPLSPPVAPVYANVTAAPHGDPAQIRACMVKQVTASVRWSGIIGAFQNLGVETYYEFGPGRVLSGLVKRIDRSAVLHTIHDLSGLHAAAGAGSPEPEGKEHA